jgi:asparagine synthase (glutamine-hydrolysing)
MVSSVVVLAVDAKCRRSLHEIFVVDEISMCGIVGISGKVDTEMLRKMNSLLVHRGPDGSGEFIDQDRDFGFAMRRLSIIDLEKGMQPMANEDESLWVVCNGEIYNSPELRQKLIATGHLFRTNNSDVEVLLHLYEEKKEALLHDLNGMFAFVIYDQNRKMLFGARDRIGIKPFYYSLKDGKFAFASELKCLLDLPWVSRELNFQSLYHYMSLQFTPAPDSIFRDIKKLPPGYYVTYNLSTKQLHLERYWALDVSHVEQRSSEEWSSMTWEKIKEAVKRWTLSDVPIACSLSGGLDSSALVGLLAESGVQDLRTYSLGFGEPDEQGCNELPLARKVAERWETDHHEVILEPKRVLNDLEKMVWHLDEPYGGGLPSWYIYEMIGRDVKVCLTGTGGDELFGNYGKYRVYESKLLRGHKMIRDLWASGSIEELKEGFRFPIGHYYHKYFSDAVKDEFVFVHESDSIVKTEPFLETLWKKSGSASPRNAVAYVDFQLQLPEEFLHVTDRFSMAHSVEARVPYLDHTLVEFVFRMHPLVRTGGKEPKSFFKGIVEKLLPQELYHAPKSGFILPLHLWTRRELRPLIEEVLSPDYLRRQGIFSSGVYEKIVKPHLSNRIDFTQQIWTLFMFQMWHREYC